MIESLLGYERVIEADVYTTGIEVDWKYAGREDTSVPEDKYRGQMGSVCLN